MNRVFIALLFGCSAALCQDINLTGYTMTFHDEFDTLSVDVSPPVKDHGETWYYWPPYGPSGAYSAGQWGQWNHSVNNGILSMLAHYVDTREYWGGWYSAQISSMDEQANGFSQQYGYFSARIKMPQAGQGAWPSFWLGTVNSIISRNNSPKSLEIDILEWYGNNPGQVHHVLHPWNGDGSQTGDKAFTSNVSNASTEFHIYGCLVKPDTITWYVDGIQTGQVATPKDYIGPMYMMVAYALGGGWPLTGQPYASHGDSNMQVDWVRVYSLPVEQPSPTPSPTPQPGRIKGYYEGYLDGIFIPQ